MKSIIKALSITAPLILLLVPSVSGDRSASAAPITTLAQDTAEWIDASSEIVKFYKPGDTAAFFIADDDLESTKSTTATWSTSTRVVAAGTTFSIPDGLVGGTSASFGSYAIGAGSVYSTTSPATTPLVSVPVVDVGPSGGALTGTAVTGHSATAGTFTLFGAVPATNDVRATFNYHLIDTYPADNTGTVTSNENKAKVTSTSDPTGEWVTIDEVAALGATTPKSATSKIFGGQIILSSDAAATARNDLTVWVQDGDTLTLTYYASDHTTVIDSTTASIDATSPTISNVVPADGSVVSSASPSVTFTIEDGGAGFNTSAPGHAVDVKINGCPVRDSELIFTSLTAIKLDIFFGLPGGSRWADAPTPSCAARTGGGFGILTTNVGPNSHGAAFTWKIVATDGAGNAKTLDLNLTVDTVRPDLIDAATGKGWDADKKADKFQKNSIKVTFNEGLDPGSVAIDGSDFTVEGASVTAALVAGVDNTSTGRTNDKDEFVYLTLAADLSADARPKVELNGSVKDKAGNELKPAAGQTVADSISAARDGIKPTVSDVTVSARLLARDGESVLTFTSDENLTGTGEALGPSAAARASR